MILSGPSGPPVTSVPNQNSELVSPLLFSASFIQTNTFESSTFYSY